ncbi:MAG: aminoglycoside phosphotransferase family protein [Nocardioidaceae bacterium]|nr:aminoglycoside phosphotransferase family protein [Nocardioidaceae bacterium]
MDDAELLAVLRPVLASELAPDEQADKLAIVGRPNRNRSSLYFVGVEGRGRVPRWVLKIPTPERLQHDLRSPLGAAEQFHTVRHLYDHLVQDGIVTTPRPIAHLAVIDGWVMEFVTGSTVADVARSTGLVCPAALVRAVEAGAMALTQLHLMEPERLIELDLAEAEQRAIAGARGQLAAAGLSVKPSWFTAVARPGTRVLGRQVLLHGDWVPENVMLSSSGVVCLDPDLSSIGWAEHDVARFVLMLFDAPLFVLAGDAPYFRPLRRRATAAFLSAYYEPGAQPSALLRPLMLAAVAARWRARHEDIARREASLRRLRRETLRRHFSSLLDEVNDPGWPLSYR